MGQRDRDSQVEQLAGIMAVATILATTAIHFVFPRTLRLQAARNPSAFRVVAGNDDDPMRRRALIAARARYVLAPIYTTFFIALILHESRQFNWATSARYTSIGLALTALLADLCETTFAIRALKSSPKEGHAIAHNVLAHLKWLMIFLTVCSIGFFGDPKLLWHHFGFYMASGFGLRAIWGDLIASFCILWLTIFCYAFLFLHSVLI